MELQQRITLNIELRYQRAQLFTLKDFPFHTICGAKIYTLKGKTPFLGIYDIFLRRRQQGFSIRDIDREGISRGDSAF